MQILEWIDAMLPSRLKGRTRGIAMQIIPEFHGFFHQLQKDLFATGAVDIMTAQVVSEEATQEYEAAKRQAADDKKKRNEVGLSDEWRD